MTSVQLPLPFGLPEATPMEPYDRSTEKTLSMNAFAPRHDILQSVNSSYRVAELMDEAQDDEIVALTKEFIADVDLNEWFDELTLRKSCIEIRDDLDRANVNCFIAYYHDKPTGFLVGTASRCFHRPGLVAEQKLWYVRPTARSGPAAALLIRAYERWATDLGATQLFTGTANSRYAERTIRTLKKLGYVPVGALLVKETQT